MIPKDIIMIKRKCFLQKEILFPLISFPVQREDKNDDALFLSLDIPLFSTKVKEKEKEKKRKKTREKRKKLLRRNQW